jgi:hypothetical protein
MRQEKSMRDDVMLKLIQRATEDPAFRQRVLADPETALAAEGYDLTEDELAAIRSFQAQVEKMSEEELTDKLDNIDRTGGP